MRQDDETSISVYEEEEQTKLSIYEAVKSRPLPSRTQNTEKQKSV